MRLSSIVLSVVILGGLAACEAEPAVPAKPTWVDDVEPILRSNCFHCHGQAGNYAGLMTKRWDFYDFSDPKLTALGMFGSSQDLVSANDPAHFALMSAYVQTPDLNGRMPPPPASGLDAREIQVLKGWMADGYQRGVRAANAKPTAAWLVKPTSVVVSDADREQVLGKISCGNAEQPILHSGTTTLPQGWMPPCTVTLYDGQDMVSVNLN
jgi:hypothetical protein